MSQYPNSERDVLDRLLVRVPPLGVRALYADLDDAGTAVKLSPRGLVAKQEWFVEPGGWTKALDAAGLSE